MQLLLFFSLLLVFSCHADFMMKYGPQFVGRDTSSDGLLTNVDDGHVKLEFKTPFIIDGEKFYSAYVNVDGLITFDAPSSSFDPKKVEGPYIAAFWGDVDLTGEVEDGNSIYYRVSESPADTDWVRIALQESLASPSSSEWRPTSVAVATWDKVGHFMSQTNLLNTFQVVLATDGVESFSITNYPAKGLNWWMSEQGQTTSIGFRTRDTEDKDEASDKEDIIHEAENTTNSQSGKVGRRVNKFDGLRPLLSGVVDEETPCFFGGSQIQVGGFGFLPSDSLLCRFYNHHGSITTQGTFVSFEEVRCDVPAWNAQEMVNISITINGGSAWSEPIPFMLSDCILSYFPVETCVDETSSSDPVLLKVESFPNPWNPAYEYMCSFGDQVVPGVIQNEVLACPLPSFSSVETVPLKVVVKDQDRLLNSRPFGKLAVTDCMFVVNKIDACRASRRVILLQKEVTEAFKAQKATLIQPSGQQVEVSVSVNYIELTVPEDGHYVLNFESGTRFSFDIDCSQ